MVTVILQVTAYQWGDNVKELLPAPDLITGADIVYQQQHFAALIITLQDLAAPHTLIYLAFKLRGMHRNRAVVSLLDLSIYTFSRLTWKVALQSVMSTLWHNDC